MKRHLSRSTSPSRVLASAVLGLACLVAIHAGRGRSFISVAWDPHEVNCLPELHLALLVHRRPSKVERGDYLFWKAPAIGALSYVSEDVVLKRVAGIPGDRLDIRTGRVFINDRLVAEGLEDAVLYERRPVDFERREVIPPGHYFVIGTAHMSNDSRYWGYLAHGMIAGKGYRIY